MPNLISNLKDLQKVKKRKMKESPHDYPRKSDNIKLEF